MQFRIRDIREDEPPVSQEGTVALPDFARLNVGVEAVSDVRVAVALDLASRVCHVQGDLSADVVYRCSRCLTSFPADLTSSLDESFTEWPDKANEDVHLVTGEWVSLDEYVAESMQLALEYRPLCKADCKGLCPQCGRDLNVETCDCQQDSVDPRLEALRDLLSPRDSE